MDWLISNKHTNDGWLQVCRTMSISGNGARELALRVDKQITNKQSTQGTMIYHQSVDLDKQTSKRQPWEEGIKICQYCLSSLYSIGLWWQDHDGVNQTLRVQVPGQARRWIKALLLARASSIFRDYYSFDHHYLTSWSTTVMCCLQLQLSSELLLRLFRALKSENLEWKSQHKSPKDNYQPMLLFYRQSKVLMSSK